MRAALLRWYDHNGRDYCWRTEGESSYKRILAELLLQRTRADTVAEFLPRFLAKFPGWVEVANASIDDLEKALLPIGLWKRRALALHSFAKALEMLDWQLTADGPELRKLPGVGPYMGNAIGMILGGPPQPLLDVNMARVLERLFGSRELADIRYDPWLQALSTRLVRGRRAVEVNWALLDFGALVCTASRPTCGSCSLASKCAFLGGNCAPNVPPHLSGGSA